MGSQHHPLQKKPTFGGFGVKTLMIITIVTIWLVVWNMSCMTFHILGILLPFDFHIFRGVGIPPTRSSNHSKSTVSCSQSQKTDIDRTWQYEVTSDLAQHGGQPENPSFSYWCLVQCENPKIAKLPYKWLNSMVYSRYNYS